MAGGTEILSKIGVGSGMNNTEIIEALVEADSAASKENLDKLEEAILLQAEIQNLKSNPSKKASGIICLLYTSPSPRD